MSLRNDAVFVRGVSFNVDCFKLGETGCEALLDLPLEIAVFELYLEVSSLNKSSR
jgi:hypothetical protein